MSIGELATSGDNSTLVESCECPEGYEGLSCEHCAWGYVKVIKNGTDHRNHHVCVKCDCNGHASTCDLLLGECTVSTILLVSFTSDPFYCSFHSFCIIIRNIISECY